MDFIRFVFSKRFLQHFAVSLCILGFLIAMVFPFIKTSAQNYSVESIPDSLKENAHCLDRQVKGKVMQ